MNDKLTLDYQYFFDRLRDTDLAPWLEQLPEQITHGLSEQRFGDLPRWKKNLSELPDWPADVVDLSRSAITITGSANKQQMTEFENALQAFKPWRKGPFKLFDVAIDTEWRSDWKWNRLIEHIQPLKGRQVLDIGCGSGYHCWRMRGAGADLVVGIEPSPLFVVQFFILQKYIQDKNIAVLPLKIEDLPKQLQFFDTTFSMGILYHRRSPIDHLIELRDTLKSGGELILETLVIEGEQGDTLVPEGRYAKMGNVWFIPSTATLSLWLKKVGFKNIHLIDVSTTSCDEQRQTDWMSYHSLAEFLDPCDSSKTIEGYPAPKRAIFSAIAP